MNNLTLKEIKELKKDLTKDITDKVNHFNRVTDTRVDSIRFRYHEFISENGLMHKSSVIDSEINIAYE